MGTRGTYGFYKNGINKLAYMQFNSYPHYLGKHIVEFIRETSIEEMNQIFDKIILVDKKSKPTLEQIKECKKWVEPKISYLHKDKLEDWYALLWNAHGNLNAYKRGLKYMIESNDFIKDSTLCAWGYIINLDTNKLEIYKGGQKENQNNRYKLTQEEIDKLDSNYKYKFYNCKLIKEFDLNNIPNNWEEILDELIAD